MRMRSSAPAPPPPPPHSTQLVALKGASAICNAEQGAGGERAREAEEAGCDEGDDKRGEAGDASSDGGGDASDFFPDLGRRRRHAVSDLLFRNVARPSVR